ncbi:hypothetical protein J2X61_004426 [Bacillus sp. 3255]|nr:hypothetical protein [Bacillus sp. 3255]
MTHCWLRAACMRGYMPNHYRDGVQELGAYMRLAPFVVASVSFRFAALMNEAYRRHGSHVVIS